MKTIFTVCIIALIAAMMAMPTAAFEPGECDIFVHDGDSIKDKVSSASEGQTICVWNGTYSPFFIINKKNIRVIGEGADVVTLHCDGTHGIEIGTTQNSSGAVVDGFTVVNSPIGITVAYSAPAPNCIIRNCVFDGISAVGMEIQVKNTTLANNVFINSTADPATIRLPVKDTKFVNNTIIDSTHDALILVYPCDEPREVIIKKNNISYNSGKGIVLVNTPLGNKIYFNNFVENAGGNALSIGTSVAYWNSTEQIEYVYGSNTYTNYMGNYWGSDYTGTDADGDGIGDTPYAIPGSATDKDYHPLMEPFESYLGEAPTPPEAKYYLVPENSSAAGYCDTAEVMLMLNTTVPVQSGKIDLLYTDCCANVTSYEPDAAFFEDQTPVLVPGRLTVGFAHWAGAVPTNQPAGVYHLGNFTVHCCNETVPCCETDLTFDDVGLWDETGATPSFVTENGTFECVAPPTPTTRYVCAAGCEYTNIQDAIDASSDGDTVFVYNGTYSGYDICINKPNITVKGEGADVVIFDGGGSCNVWMPSSSGENAFGSLFEGFTVVNSPVGLYVAVFGTAQNCIVKSCVFDFEGSTAAECIRINADNFSFENNAVSNATGKSVTIKGSNCTLKNNVVLNSTHKYLAVFVKNSNTTIINNTIKGSKGAAISLDGADCVNCLVIKNNLTSNTYAGIELYNAGPGNKIYLNNFIDNGKTVTTSGKPAPAVTYWNSTEQIEYTYDSYEGEDYLGNYWSPQYTGTDGDGDGIGDTAYVVPDGLGEDYRPLMAGYESYLGEAAEDKPDLNVTAITTPASIIATQSNSIESTIANIGSADAGSFNVSLSADGTEIEEVNVTAGIGAGNSTEVTFEWTPSASGTYELCVVADCKGAVDESNETNNVTCMNVAVIVPPLTSITITPDTGITGQASAYDIIVNTTGFKSLTVTIPAGFSAKTPSDGEQIARVDLWWANEGAPHYGYVTFTANATDKMDVDAEIEETSIAYPGMAVNYTEGATTSIKSPFGSQEERANLTLPTESVNGSLTISGLPETITNVTVSIGTFVQNPTTADDYTFTAKAEGEAVGKSAAVTISAPAVPGIVSYAPSAAAISDTEDAARTFNVTVNQTVNVSWLVNGTQVQFNNTGGVTEASYTNTSAVIGTWNVSAVASNTNGTVMQTWIWTVEKLSPCFIATAAYGTSLHEDIDVLRDFRDERLMTNPLGRTFVKTYYETSPPIADALREHEGLRTAVRETLIKPLVYVSRMFITTD